MREDKQFEFDRKSKLGWLAAKKPACARVFEKYAIDYACGGQRSLEEACQCKGLEVEPVIEELEALAEDNNLEDLDWTASRLSELIVHIVLTYHRPLQNQLPRVITMAEELAEKHGKEHPELLELLHLLRKFSYELELHMHKEEMVLFPAIANIEQANGRGAFGSGAGIDMPVSVNMQEHESAFEILAEMQNHTSNFAGLTEFSELQNSLQSINSVMQSHVHKENNILFPRALALVKEVSV